MLEITSRSSISIHYILYSINYYIYCTKVGDLCEFRLGRATNKDGGVLQFGIDFSVVGKVRDRTRRLPLLLVYAFEYILPSRPLP